MSTTVRIVKTPDVLHGKPRVDGTRVGVLAVGEFVDRHGQSIEAVQREFDLDRAQAEAAIDYYETHPELMETLRAQEKARRRSIQAKSRLQE